MMLQSNDGDRPSRLALARYATGELEGDEHDTIALWLQHHPEGRDYLDALDAHRAHTPALDLDALRRRTPADSAPANNRTWFGVLLAIAALLMFALIGTQLPTPDGGPQIRTRGGAPELSVYALQRGNLRAYAGAPLGEGDVVGFKVAGDHDGVVLLSIDGSGTLSVYWPARGEQPVPLPRTPGLVALQGSLTLDDAPGPELFVAVFDQTVTEARQAAEQAWVDGGAEGLRAWAERSERVDLVEVLRR